MIVVPLSTSDKKRGPFVLLIIIEKENLDRMKAGDPADFQPAALTKQFSRRYISDLDIVIAYENNMGAVNDFLLRDDIPGLIEYLQRGRSTRGAALDSHTAIKAPLRIEREKKTTPAKRSRSRVEPHAASDKPTRRTPPDATRDFHEGARKAWVTRKRNANNRERAKKAWVTRKRNAKKADPTQPDGEATP